MQCFMIYIIEGDEGGVIYMFRGRAALSSSAGVSSDITVWYHIL